MKKIMALLLALTMLLSLAACGAGYMPDGNGQPEAQPGKNAGQAETADTAGDDSAQDEDDAVRDTEPGDVDGADGADGADDSGAAQQAAGEQAKAVTVTLSDAGELIEDNGIPLLHFGLYSAEVTVDGDPVASEKISSAIAAANDTFASEKEADVEMAREGYSLFADPEYWCGYARERSYSVMRNDGVVLSLRLTDFYDYGGAHPSTIYSAKNYDISTGNELTLNDIAENIDTFMVYAIETVTEQINSQAGLAAGLFSDYQQYISSFVADGCWYFGETGLVFICNAMTIAPYAAGMMEFEIPYEKLQGMVKEIYLPARVLSGVNAQPNICYRSGVDRSGSGQYSTVVLDVKGERFCIWFDAPVTDVILQRVVAHDKTLVYEPVYTLFSASVMNPEDTLEVDTYVPEIIPDLMISWRQGDGTVVSRLISVSGDDGSPLLVEP